MVSLMANRETATIDEGLRAFIAFFEREGLPPTVREFQIEAGLSSSSVAAYHLGRLEEGGWIRRRTNEGLSRGWLPTKKALKAKKKAKK